VNLVCGSKILYVFVAGFRPTDENQQQIVLVNQMLHVARRAEALGYRYEGRLRGLGWCSMQLPSTKPATKR
jgi:hypothetical protein